jgi:hypothetical protein
MKIFKKIFKWPLIALVVIFALIALVPYLIPLQEQAYFTTEKKTFSKFKNRKI